MEKELMTNVQAELLLVGSLYKQPDLYITYGKNIRSKYDFSDVAMKFFYDMFEDYYLTFSQDITENKINNFATQNMNRLKMFKEYGGWKTIKTIMDMADTNDVKYIYDTVKKYALVREYDANGFPAEKIVAFKNFEKLKASDVYKLIRAKADKINTNVSNMDEPDVLTEGMSTMIDTLIHVPQMGYVTPFQGFNDYFRGCLKGTTLFFGATSNLGKSRFATFLLSFLSMIRGQKVMMLSTEMTLQSIKQAFLVTVINNDEFAKLHGIRLNKNEKEIALGLYKDNNGNFIERVIDKTTGEFESDDSYFNRIKNTNEYKKVVAIAQWTERQMNGKFFFEDISSDYSIENIDMEMRKASIVYGCTVICIDTLKNYNSGDWSVLKQTATRICEITKENENFYTLCTFQLKDEALNMPVEDINSNQIGEAKAIKHVADAMVLSKRLEPTEYYKYQYIPYDDGGWGECIEQDLNENKSYIASKIEKNRMSENGKIILFEVDLNKNTWDNVGILVKK